MDKIQVVGGRPLFGEIEISGAKNACLTLMPAALLTDQPLTLTNAPRLADIQTMSELLRSLGCEVASLQDGNVLAVSAKSLTSHTAQTSSSGKALVSRSTSCSAWMGRATGALRPEALGISAQDFGATLLALADIDPELMGALDDIAENGVSD